MAELRRFRPQRERQTAAFVAQWRQLLLELPPGAPPERIEAVRRELDAIERHAEGWRFMQINPDRQAAIRAALRELRCELPSTLMVMQAVAEAVSPVDQWCTKTQQEIADELRISRFSASRAFKALAQVGALTAHRPERRSKLWELDATWCTRLSSDARAIEATRQGQAKAAAANAAADRSAQPSLTLIDGGAA